MGGCSTSKPGWWECRSPLWMDGWTDLTGRLSRLCPRRAPAAAVATPTAPQCPRGQRKMEKLLHSCSFIMPLLSSFSKCFYFPIVKCRITDKRAESFPPFLLGEKFDSECHSLYTPPKYDFRDYVDALSDKALTKSLGE